MTLNEGLTFIKLLKQRHAELSRLQQQNAKKSTHYYAENPIVDEPTYDVKELDKKINNLASEIRHLDSAIKKTNAITDIVDYVDPGDGIFEGPR